MNFVMIFQIIVWIWPWTWWAWKWTCSLHDEHDEQLAWTWALLKNNVLSCFYESLELSVVFSLIKKLKNHYKSSYSKKSKK